MSVRSTAPFDAMSITFVYGSPALRSRSTTLADALLRHVQAQGHRVEQVTVRRLPASALIGADAADEAVRAALDKVARSSAVVFATPIYKGAYSGLLKLFIDLLPQEGLAGKVALPLATGGGAAHFMALDYALKPVLAALGARCVLPGVFATDAQIGRDSVGQPGLDEATALRIDCALDDLLSTLDRIHAGPSRTASPAARVAPRLALI